MKKGKKMAADKLAIGLEQQIIDEETGVPTAFHVVGQQFFDYGRQYYTATPYSYYNRRPWEQGKAYIGTGVQVVLTGEPPRGSDVQTWILETAAAQVPEGAADAHGNLQAGSVFAGAKVVYL